MPYVIEPAVGVNRLMLALLCAAFYDPLTGEQKAVLDLHPDISPVKYAVLPIVKKQEVSDCQCRCQ